MKKVFLITSMLVTLLVACNDEEVISEKDELKNNIVESYIIENEDFYNIELVKDVEYKEFIDSDNYKLLVEYYNLNKEVYNEIIKSYSSKELNTMEYSMLEKEYSKYNISSVNKYEKELLILLNKQKNNILSYYNYNDNYFNISEITSDEKIKILEYKLKNEDIKEFMLNYYKDMYLIESILKNKEVITLINNTPVEYLEENINKKLYNTIRSSTVGYDFIDLTIVSVVSEINENKIDTYLDFIYMYLVELEKLKLNEEMIILNESEIKEKEEFIKLVKELYESNTSLDRKNEIKKILKGL